jgi:hypothetical protein
MKKTISMYYTDVLESVEDTIIYKWLTERYTVIVDPINPDFLFYNIFGDDYKKYHGCVKTFIVNEDEAPNFNECDYAAGFVRLSYGDRYFRRVPDLCELDKSIQDRSSVSEAMLNRKFCNFIYSNPCYGEGAYLRQELCKKLMEYKRVDCPGRVLNNMDRSVIEEIYFNDWRGSKRKFQSNYKFTIAFENGATEGYITEKVLDALMAFSVPIYYGDPDVNLDLNPKAFINAADYGFDLDKIVQRVIELDNDNDAYLAMLREKPMQPDFRFDGTERFKEWIFSIIEKGRKPFNKDPRDVSRNKTRMRAIKNEYRAQHGIRNEDFIGMSTSNSSDFAMFLTDYKKKKYRLKKLRYEILSKILFGRARKKYQEKYIALKQKINEIR